MGWSRWLGLLVDQNAKTFGLGLRIILESKLSCKQGWGGRVGRGGWVVGVVGVVGVDGVDGVDGADWLVWFV